jgi:hypothetical protein
MSRLVDIKVDDLCMQTYPCKHHCLLVYDDGTTVAKILVGPICQLIFNKLGKVDSHFDYDEELLSYYKDDCLLKNLL